MKVAIVKLSSLNAPCPMCKMGMCWSVTHRMCDTARVDADIVRAKKTLKK